MKLTKKIGGKRHREWAWALVVIAACTAAVAWWGSQDFSYAPQGTVGSTQKPASGSTGGSKPADTSLAGVLRGIPGTSAFNSYFVANNMAAELGKGPYTIFVPTDSAFAALAKGTITGMSTTAQKRWLEYHIVAGRALDNDAISSGNYQALSRDTLNFNVNLQTGASYVGSGKILAQYKADNGIIYTISSVLFPPQQ